jgi:hypothetical protein
MSRSKKLTVKQLTDLYNTHEQLIDMTNTRIDFMAQAVIGDFERMNMLLMKLIEELGYIKEKECMHDDCDAVFAWPALTGIPEPMECPDCNGKAAEEE